MPKLKADYVATGHYCIKEKRKKTSIYLNKVRTAKRSKLFKTNKSKQLEKIIFPIDILTKKEVMNKVLRKTT